MRAWSFSLDCFRTRPRLTIATLPDRLRNARSIATEGRRALCAIPESGPATLPGDAATIRAQGPRTAEKNHVVVVEDERLHSLY